MSQVENILDDRGPVFQTAAAGIVKVSRVGRIVLSISAGYRRLLQQIGQIMHCVQRRAPVFPNDLNRGLSHTCTKRVILRDFQECGGQAGGIRNHPTGAHFAQQGIGIFKVFHAGANQNRFRMRGRLQHIMPAMMHQTAADKDDIAHRIDAPQFTDRINQKHRILRTFAFQVFQFGAETGFIAEFGCQAPYLLRPGRLAGRDDQTGLRIFVAQFPEREQDRVFFRRMGRTGDDHRIRVLSQAQLGFIGRQIFRRNFSISLIELGIAGHKNFSRVRA